MYSSYVVLQNRFSLARIMFVTNVNGSPRVLRDHLFVFFSYATISIRCIIVTNVFLFRKIAKNAIVVFQS